MGLYRFVIACALLAGCDTSLDRDKLTGDIISTLKAKGVDATVHCPEIKKLTQNMKFQCGGAAFGRSFEVDVVVIDDKGTLKWDLVGKIIETAELATFVQPKISAKITAPALVTCADKKAVLAPKDVLTCDITIEGKLGHVAITVAANGDDVTWEILK